MYFQRTQATGKPPCRGTPSRRIERLKEEILRPSSVEGGLTPTSSGMSCGDSAVTLLARNPSGEGEADRPQLRRHPLSRPHLPQRGGHHGEEIDPIPTRSRLVQ